MTDTALGTPAYAAPHSRAWTVRHGRALVTGSRTALLMLLIAALVMVGLGAISFAFNDSLEVDGWVRYLFGTAFTMVALGMGAVIGLPSAVGVWATAGATRDDATPALSPRVRQVLAGVGMATTAVTVAVLGLAGSAVPILNFGLAGLVALASFGLAGAAWFSPHRVRAIASGGALVLVDAGTLWVLFRAFVDGAG